MDFVSVLVVSAFMNLALDTRWVARTPDLPDLLSAGFTLPDLISAFMSLAAATLWAAR